MEMETIAGIHAHTRSVNSHLDWFMCYFFMDAIEKKTLFRTRLMTLLMAQLKTLLRIP